MNANIYIVTGANAGIGLKITELLATEKKNIIMACRNMEKSTPVLTSIKQQTNHAHIELWQLDLSSLKSIQAFVEKAKQRNIRIKALINNAGIMSKDFQLTEDGFETDMGVNYVGTYALTRALIPLMGKGSSILNTVSLTRKISRIDNDILNPSSNNFSRLKRYGNSKLALLFFTAALYKRTAKEGISVNGIDPGIVDTNMISMQRWFDPLADIFFRPFIKSPEKAARIFLNALNSHVSGFIFKSNGKKSIGKDITDNPLCNILWNDTESKISQ